jgi:hypothetical protein
MLVQFGTDLMHSITIMRRFFMLTLEDCADYCDLGNDEIAGLAEGLGLPAIEVCAMVQEYADTPSECRKMLQLLHGYLEKVESQGDDQRSHEVHEAILHFAATHHFV